MSCTTRPLATRVRIPSHVVHRRFEAETVILNLQSGQYHGLNGTAAHIFELLERHEDTTATLHALAEQYTVPYDQLAQDVNDLCHQLAARGLLELDG